MINNANTPTRIRRTQACNVLVSTEEAEQRTACGGVGGVHSESEKKLKSRRMNLIKR